MYDIGKSPRKSSLFFLTIYIQCKLCSNNELENNLFGEKLIKLEKYIHFSIMDISGELLTILEKYTFIY